MWLLWDTVKAHWVAALWCLTVAQAGEFAGPERCKNCHPKQYATQAQSHHAFALRPIQETRLPELLQKTPLGERSGIRFDYQNLTSGLMAIAASEKRFASALLEWAFGSGAQAFTPVGRIGEKFLEHRVSYYMAAPGARLTIGHASQPSRDPQTSLGLVQNKEAITRCFNCHATGVKSGPDLTAMIPGVTCERCHGPAGEHAKGPGSMPVLGSLSAEKSIKLCAACHRMPQPMASLRPEVDDPESIRFAPVGLMASKCFRGSRALSCATCHDPHQNASQDAALYASKCMVCHETRPEPCAASPICIDCHMQQRSPAPYLTFTDHRIRVYRSSP